MSMTETVTIELDSKLKRALDQKCRAMKMPVDKVVEQLIRGFVNAKDSQMKATYLDEVALNQFLAEQLKDVKIADDDLFFGDLTVKEYFALSDEEREALWTKAYLEELDKTESEEEKEVSPHAVPVEQRSHQEFRRRLAELRARPKIDS